MKRLPFPAWARNLADQLSKLRHAVAPFIFGPSFGELPEKQVIHPLVEVDHGVVRFQFEHPAIGADQILKPGLGFLDAGQGEMAGGPLRMGGDELVCGLERFRAAPKQTQGSGAGRERLGSFGCQHQRVVGGVQ